MRQQSFSWSSLRIFQSRGMHTLTHGQLKFKHCAWKSKQVAKRASFIFLYIRLKESIVNIDRKPIVDIFCADCLKIWLDIVKLLKFFFFPQRHWIWMFETGFRTETGSENAVQPVLCCRVAWDWKLPRIWNEWLVSLILPDTFKNNAEGVIKNIKKHKKIQRSTSQLLLRQP